MKHTPTIGLVFFATLFCVIPAMAFADDVVLHVYGQVPSTPQGWALSQQIVSMDEVSESAVFDALKRKKLPTYGDTQYDAEASAVTIDPTKCAYSAIISTEIARSFEQNGFKQPLVQCGEVAVSPDPSALAHTVNVIPVWQAIGEQTKNMSPWTYVDTTLALVPYNVYRQKLASGDKATLKTVEMAFDSESEFVQRQTMLAATSARLPGAEMLIAKRLSSKSLMTRANAVRSLKHSTNGKILSQIRDVLAKASPADKRILAEAALDTQDAGLRRLSAIALLSAADTALFQKALKALTPDEISAELASSLDSAATPAHAAQIAGTQFGTDHRLLQNWLDRQQGTANAVAVADAVLSSNIKDDALVASAHAVMMLSDNFDHAEKSFYQLTKKTVFDLHANTPLSDEAVQALKRAQTSSSVLISWAAFDRLMAPVVKNEAYDVAAAQKKTFDNDWTVRAALALELAQVNASADALRNALIKDSEPHVVHAMIDSLARMHETRFARELIQIAKMETEDTRLLILRAMPSLMDETNATAVTAFVSNELFDGAPMIKIAALYALARIAHDTKDPVIADNAISSMSLTVQDKDKRIVHHTLLALADTGHPSVYPLLDAAEPLYPDSVAQARQRLADQ